MGEIRVCRDCMEDFYEFPGMDRDTCERCTSIASAERAVIEAAEELCACDYADERRVICKIVVVVDALRKAREGR